MRKFVCVLLTLVLVLAMGTTAIAADSTIETSPGSQDIDVSAKYVDGVSGGTKYSVDVAWGAMEFTYTVSGTKTWNPATHDYVISTSGAWTESGNTITVTNHSNTGITASFAFAPLTEYNTVAGTFSASSVQLPSAEGKALDAAELTGTTTLTLGGTLADTVTTMTKVGAITVTIS